MPSYIKELSIEKNGDTVSVHIPFENADDADRAAKEFLKLYEDGELNIILKPEN